MNGIVLNSASRTGQSKISINFSLLDVDGYESNNIYIRFKNENSNYFDRGLSTNLSNPVGVEVGELVANIDLVSGYLSNDTNWTIKLESSGYFSNEITVFMPFEGSIPDDFIIPERPTQQTQNVFYDGIYKGQAECCVANSVASAKNIQELRNGKTVLDYSIMWFYGATGLPNEQGVVTTDALDFLKNRGIPPYQVVANAIGVSGYPDVAFISEAKNIYTQNNTSNVNTFALPQKIASWSSVGDLFDTGFYNTVINAIKTKTVIITIGIDKSLDDAFSNGIVGGVVGQIRSYHTMVMLGVKTINSKKYWIVQNSWTYTNGVPYGDNGLYYIPFSWFTFDYCGICEFYILEDDPNAPALPPIPETLTPPYLKSEDSTSITMAWSGLIGSTNYELRIRDENGGYTTYQTKNLEYRLNSLSYGYRYWISLRAYRGGVWTNYTNETKVITKPRCANISRVYSTTPNNLLVELDTDFVTGRFTGFEIRRHTYPYTDTILDRKYNYALNGTSEWTGLTTGSRFSFTTMTFLDLDEGRIWSIYRSTEVDGTVGSIRPPYFSWDTQKVKGNPFSDLKASEWIGLINNIKLMMTYKGLNPSNYTFTLPNKGDTFMVSHWTQVRNAIYNTLNSSVYIPSKSKGAQIKADDINLLVTSLNSIK